MLKLEDFKKFELTKQKSRLVSGGRTVPTIGQTEHYVNFLGFIVHTGSSCDTDTANA